MKGRPKAALCAKKRYSLHDLDFIRLEEGPDWSIVAILKSGPTSMKRKGCLEVANDIPVVARMNPPIKAEPSFGNT